jgi:hypothetical protein
MWVLVCSLQRCTALSSPVSTKGEEGWLVDRVFGLVGINKGSMNPLSVKENIIEVFNVSRDTSMAVSFAFWPINLGCRCEYGWV